MNNNINVVLFVLIAFWLATTFIFSAQEGKQSTVTSQGVIQTVIDKLPHTKELSDNEKKDLIQKWKKPIRKLAHFSIYLIGGFLIYALVNNLKLQIAVKILVAQVVGTMFATFDEVHQLFVPGRSGEVFDVCIDSMGILVGILLAVLVISIVEKRKVKDL